MPGAIQLSSDHYHVAAAARVGAAAEGADGGDPAEIRVPVVDDRELVTGEPERVENRGRKPGFEPDQVW